MEKNNLPKKEEERLGYPSLGSVKILGRTNECEPLSKKPSSNPKRTFCPILKSKKGLNLMDKRRRLAHTG